MMKTYAHVIGGVVMELIPPYAPAGEQIPLDQMYPANFVAECVDITGIDPEPQQNWTYDGSVFSPPVPYTPTPADIFASNSNYQEVLKTQASQAMTPLLMALQLDGSDEVTAKARQWRDYYQALQEVDLTVSAPAWPIAPE